jgi:phage tail sheath protein FI
MAYQRPGVYVQETLNPIAPVLGPSSDSVAAFVGANDRGPTSPSLVTSWSQYVNQFGSWNTTASNDLPIAVYMFFANGGSQAYVNRVVGTSAAVATRTLTDRAGTPLNTLTIQSKNAGTWGNNINISVVNSTVTGYIDLVVYYNGSTDADIVERFTDITMVSTDSRYAPTVINSLSRYIVAIDQNSATAGSNKNPSVISNQSLASGANGSSITSSQISASLEEFDTVPQSLVLNVPGYTDATVVNIAIAYAETRDDVFVVVDGANDTVANQLTLAASYTPSSLAAVYYPRLVISDPTLGVGASAASAKIVGPGGAVVGLMASTDASRGVFKAPAGLTARLAGAVSVPALTNAELDSLNSAGAPVNAIRFISGSGIVVMGSRTIKTGYVDRYVPVRRTLIYLRKAVVDLTQFAIFEPNDPSLWRRIDASLSSFLTNFWSQGGLRGNTPAEAFFVKVDAENNTQATIDNGEVNIEIGVALQRPAEFIIIKIGQFDGGTTVTVA